MEEQTLVAFVGFAVMIVLMLIRVPIGACLGIVAIGGFAYMQGWWPALGLLIHSPIRTVTDFNFSVIPMFVLMGTLVAKSGMSAELFRVARAWLGHLPGGLAMATVFACGGFAAINGSTVATAATMTTVALPEMRRYGYHPGLSMGVIAAGATALVAGTAVYGGDPSAYADNIKRLEDLYQPFKRKRSQHVSEGKALAEKLERGDE